MDLPLAIQRRGTILSEIPLEWLEYSDSGEPKVTDLTSQEVTILELCIDDLSRELLARNISAVQVATAYCHAAASVHMQTCCLSKLLYTSAIQQATDLDHHYETFQTPRGKLHGIPISVTDSLLVAGTDSSLGLISLIDNNPHNLEASLVSKLRDEGAVIFAKTAVSAGGMSCECESNVFGRTLNPFSPAHIPGSNSGGEGPLLALRGSLVGVGTDLAGATRFACAFQGLYGLKPSAGALPNDGIEYVLPDIPLVKSTASPMARSLRSLERFMDATYVESSIKEQSESPPPVRTRVAVIRSISTAPIDADVSEALESLVSKLDECPIFDVIEFGDTTVCENAAIAVSKLLFKFGKDPIAEAIQLGDEPWLPQLKLFRDSDIETHTTELYDRALSAREDLLRTVESLNVDIVLSPVACKAAFVWGDPLAADISYTCTWNLCNYVCGVFPVSEVPSGAPMGFQIIGKKFQEALVLDTMRKIVDIL